MKRTIWRPVIFGAVMGLLAGIATVTELAFLTTGLTQNSVGFFMTLFLLAAALGGPLAGVIAPVFMMVISLLYGPSDFKEVLSPPAVFWSNVLAAAGVMVLVSFAYRFIFRRVKMPKRLLAWAGIIIAAYAILSPASIIPQNILMGETALILPETWYAYQTYVPQAIFDIFVTSLIFIALPPRFRRPLWLENQPAHPVTELREQNKMRNL